MQRKATKKTGKKAVLRRKRGRNKKGKSLHSSTLTEGERDSNRDRDSIEVAKEFAECHFFGEGSNGAHVFSEHISHAFSWKKWSHRKHVVAEQRAPLRRPHVDRRKSVVLVHLVNSIGSDPEPQKAFLSVLQQHLAPKLWQTFFWLKKIFLKKVFINSLNTREALWSRRHLGKVWRETQIVRHGLKRLKNVFLWMKTEKRV